MQPVVEYRTPAPPPHFRRSGFWWHTMGYTNTHRIGVVCTSTFIATLGIILGVLAIPLRSDISLRLLLGAACCLLLAIVVLLSSILSLLFYGPPHADPSSPSSAFPPPPR
jgi:hypothetical protein